MKTKFSLLIILLISTLRLYSQQIDSVNVDTIQLRETKILSPFRPQLQSATTLQLMSRAYLYTHYQGNEPSVLLQKAPNVTMYSDAGSANGYSYIRLRGIDQTRINMTLNGVPLNEPEDQGAYFSNITNFFSSLQSVEIQRGVASNLNGVTAYAGSIHCESYNLANKPLSELYMGFGSFQTLKSSVAYNSGIQRNFGLYVRGSYSYSAGYKERASNEAKSVFLSTGYFKEHNIIKLTGFLGKQDNQLSWLGAPMDSLVKNKKYNANSKEGDRFMQSLVMLQHTYQPSENWTWNNTVYHGYVDGNYDFDLNNFLQLPLTKEMYNYKLNSTHIGGFSNITRSFKTASITAGVHAYTYARLHRGTEWLQAIQLYENTGYKDDVSGFVNASKDWKSITFYANAQYRKTSFKYDGTVPLPDQNWDFFNYNLGLKYQFNPHVLIYYTHGEVNREPTRNDMFQGNDNLDTISYFVPLQLENVANDELGVKCFYDNWSWNINAFYMIFENELTLNGQFGPTGLALHSNVDDSYRMGVESDLEVKVSDYISLRNILSYMSSMITQNDTSFSPVLTPDFIVNQDLIFHWKDFSFVLSGRYQSDMYIDFANQNKVPEFFTIDAGIGYQYRQCQINLRVDNVLNKTYYSYGEMDINGLPVYHLQAPAFVFLSMRWTL